MNKIRLYFWDGQQVLEYTSWQQVPSYLNNVQCVDTQYPVSQRKMRYGKDNGDSWESCPLEELDPLFRAHLLLLGIT